ncbi:exo-beta-N-acetylmuramidase NamZ domain-containing protein [Brachybacterium sp. GCM10030268]|uniref:exo-beta-N-acetylmuramidase NamZ family protein n=1 Tax=Brachybacterium sp. GCM10030268 TaxID=3273382 RepID=UPI003609B9BB
MNNPALQPAQPPRTPSTGDHRDPEAGAERPGRRRVLASLPAGAVLATAGAASALPADNGGGTNGKGNGHGKGNGGGHGKGHGKGRFALGVENLLEADQLSTLDGATVGLITNPTGTDRELTSTIDLLIGAEEEGGFSLVALFGPEHGVRGAEPAGGEVGDYIDEKTGLPVRSLYGETQKPTPEMIADVDTLIFDIQDIGARFYTYIWTLYYAMEAAAENEKRFLVLDRPNPLGAEAEGFILEPALSSFVGLKEIPQRHGLTVGELARLFNGEFLGDAVDLEVIEMSGYDPEEPADAGLPWVLPSPNIPTAETAIVYAGTGLIESLNVSEGRGTTTPFLWFGAPFITESQIDAIITDLADLPGVLVRPMFATPTTSKHAGEFCGGLQLHVTDPEEYEPVRTGIHVLAALFRQVPEVDWREGEDCRTEADVCWIDSLSGTKRTRSMLEAGDPADEIVAAWQDELDEFVATARRYRLY